MDPTQEITNGLHQVALEPPQRKKKTARAHHKLMAAAVSPAVPQQQFTQPTPAFQQPPGSSPQQGMFSPMGANTAFSPMATPPIGATANGAFTNPSTPQQNSQGPGQMRNLQQSPFQGQRIAEDDSIDPTFRRHIGQEEYRTESFKTYNNVLPPSAVTKLVCEDQSNASPKFARLSMYAVPNTEALRASTRLPLGLTVRPFAPLDYKEEEVPEVDLSSMEGPPRCRRCRTYMNPAMVFTHDQKFICNMCKFPNQVPSEYACALDHTNRRLDVLQRPELHKGVVDFIVPETYWVDDNVQPKSIHHLFLVDLSASQEVIAATTEAIRSCLFSLPLNTKVGIITYDQTIHFYNLQSDSVQVIIASDLEDPFIPLYQGLFVDPTEHSQEIMATLNHIDSAYQDYKSNEVAYGAALKYALEALKLVGGGKVTALLTKIPSWGPGSLTVPSDTLQGSEVFKCTNEYYQRLADEYVANQAGLDLFVVSAASVNLISSANVVFKTSGALKLYSNFIPERDERQYFEDIKASVINTRGYQGHLKVRCSNGLQVSSYYGNFEAKGASDPVLPILSTDQQITVLFSYDSKLATNENVHFQTALLYTGVDGTRKVRVVNLVVSVTDKVSDVFMFADQDAVTDIIVKNCLHYISKQQPTEVKNSTKDKMVDILTQYRQLVSTPTSLPTQLVVPDSLGSLAAFICAFQKSRVFKTSVSNNFKIYDYYKLNSLPLECLMYHLYPAFISLVDLTKNDCTYDDYGLFVMPRNIRASHNHIQHGGSYFIFNGYKLLLFIHPNVNPLFVSDLFGVPSADALSATTNEFPILDTHINLQARNVVEYFTKFLGLEFLAIQLVRPGIDGAEYEFAECLVEDRALDKTESYSEFVTSMHRSIKANIDKSKASSSSAFSSPVSNGFSSTSDSMMAERFAQI